MYYVYILRCEDNSLYTGVTTDVERRYKEHIERGEKCAKYTRSHHVKSLEHTFKTESKSVAYKLEYYIKRLSKKKKEELLQNPKYLEEILLGKMDCSKVFKKNNR